MSLIILNISRRIRRLYCTARPSAAEKSTETCKRPCTQKYFGEGISDSLTNEVRKFLPSVSVEEAVTPPATWYTQPQFHTLDKASVFRKHWIPVGRVDQVRETGQYITGFIADEPFLITRDESGTLQAFYNVCRHHATLLMNDSTGTASEFQCPYHGWTYTLDGRLAKATRLRGIKNFSAKNFGLIPLGVATWGPLVFINLSDSQNSADELGKKLEEVKGRLDKMGFEDLSVQHLPPLPPYTNLKKSPNIDFNGLFYKDGTLGSQSAHSRDDDECTTTSGSYTINSDDDFEGEFLSRPKDLYV